MAFIDEVLQFVRRAKADARSEQADGLIAPGAAEGILADRHQFDMGESHVEHVGNQLPRQFDITQVAVVFLGLAPPGTGVDLVDRNRPPQQISTVAPVQPLPVAPLKVFIEHHPRSGVRRVLHGTRVRVGLGRQQLSLAVGDLELVQIVVAHIGDENFPHTGFGQWARMTWRAPSQPLKSPITETPRAFGAHTAKRTPSLPSRTQWCAPNQRQARSAVPSLKR